MELPAEFKQIPSPPLLRVVFPSFPFNGHTRSGVDFLKGQPFIFNSRTSIKVNENWEG